FRGNGHARKTEQDLIDNNRPADRPRPNARLSMLAALSRAFSRTTGERELKNPQKLNHDLMWTWFLPNPLSSPNESNWNLTSLFDSGLNCLNPSETRRNS